MWFISIKPGKLKWTAYKPCSTINVDFVLASRTDERRSREGSDSTSWQYMTHSTETFYVIILTYPKHISVTALRKQFMRRSENLIRAPQLSGGSGEKKILRKRTTCATMQRTGSRTFHHPQTCPLALCSQFQLHPMDFLAFCPYHFVFFRYVL